MTVPFAILFVGRPGAAAHAAFTATPQGAAADPAHRSVATLVEARALLDEGDRFDALVLDADGHPESAADLAAVAHRVPVVVVTVDADAEHAAGWLRQGAELVLAPDELGTRLGQRGIRHAAVRHRRAESRATAWATDAATGLPHRRQLVEHLSHLLALRERDPSPMALIALRLDLPPGREGELVWRKAAVRLRATVRASDVVAVADDALCVLLGTLLDAGDAEVVAAKLVEAMARPYPLAGGEARAGVAVGVARYPADGNQADRLLRRALAVAAAAPVLGGRGRSAANDALPT